MNDDLQYTERARMLKGLAVKNYSEARACEVAIVHRRHLDTLVARARKKVLDTRIEKVHAEVEEGR